MMMMMKQDALITLVVIDHRREVDLFSSLNHFIDSSTLTSIQSVILVSLRFPPFPIFRLCTNTSE